jgi:hypothetical protein
MSLGLIGKFFFILFFFITNYIYIYQPYNLIKNKSTNERRPQGPGPQCTKYFCFCFLFFNFIVLMGTYFEADYDTPPPSASAAVVAATPSPPSAAARGPRRVSGLSVSFFFLFRFLYRTNKYFFISRLRYTTTISSSNCGDNSNSICGDNGSSSGPEMSR